MRVCMSACVDGCVQSDVYVFIVAVRPHHKRLLYASNEMVSAICHCRLRGPGACQWNGDLELRHYWYEKHLFVSRMIFKTKLHSS